MHKGYKCPNWFTGCIYISRDVVFDETVFPFATPNARVDLSLLSPPISFPSVEWRVPKCEIMACSIYPLTLLVQALAWCRNRYLMLVLNLVLCSVAYLCHHMGNQLV